MADRIKGITIEIGGDTTGLSKALSGVNKEISSTQSALKDVERLLKLDPSNTELLKQKQKLLADAVQETKGKLDTLKEANKQTAESASNYDAWKAKYDPIKKQIDDTKKKLGDLKTQSKNADEQLANGKISQEKYDALQDEIKQTSRELRTLQKSAKEVSDEFGNPVSPEQYDALQREITETERQLKSLEDQAGKANVALQKIGIAGESIKAFGEKATGAGKALLPVTGAIAAAGGASVKMAMGFEEAMAKVDTIADTSQVPLAELEQAILDLSNQTGISSAEIAGNVYDAISAGQKTGDAVNFVSKSTKLAKAGFADAGNSLDVLTTIMNAYNLEASEAGRVTDVLIQTQNLGKTTVGELSSSMGKIIPTAKANGVALEQVAAGYAIMTSNGVATAETTTYMNSMLNELGKSGTKVSDVIRKKTGKSFKELMDGGSSLADVLNIVSDSADEQGLAFGDLWSSAEAGKAALILLGEGADDFNGTLKEMQDSTGATETAFGKLDTNSYKLQKTLNQLKNDAIVMGKSILNTLAPILEKISKKIQELHKWFSSLDEGQRETIVTAGLLVAALGPLLIVIGQIATGIGGLMTAVSGIGGALGALAASGGPLFLTALAIAGVASAFIIAIDNANSYEEKAWELSDAEKENAEAINTMRDAYDELSQRRKDAVTDIEAQSEKESDLWEELQKITDENGKVKEGYKDRAAFIVSALNEALGTEIKLNGEIIEGYQDIQKEIDNLIEKKRAEATLNAYQEEYSSAVRDRKVAQQELTSAVQDSQNATADYNTALAEESRLQSEYNRLLAEYAKDGTNDKLRTQLYDLQDQLIASGEATAGFKDRMNEVNQTLSSAQMNWEGINTTIANYEGASAAIISGDQAKISESLLLLQHDFKTTETATGESLRAQHEAIKTELANAKAAMANGAMEMDAEYIAGLEKLEMNARAELAVLAIVAGDATADAASAVKGKTGEMERSGADFGVGLATGITDAAEQVTGAATDIADATVDATRTAWDSHSPSRVAHDIGIDYPAGLADGITEGTDHVTEAVTQLATAATFTLETQLQQSNAAMQTYQASMGISWSAWAANLVTTINTSLAGIGLGANTQLGAMKSSFATETAAVYTDWNIKWTAIETKHKTTMQNIKTLTTTVLRAVKTLNRTETQTMRTDAVSAMNQMVAEIDAELKMLEPTVKSGYEPAVRYITDLIPQARIWGNDMMDGFIQGIRDKMDELEDACRDVADTVSDYMHFTRPEKGPLRNYEEWMPHMMQGLAGGIRENRRLVTDQMKALASDMAVLQISGQQTKQPVNLTSYNVIALDGKQVAEVVNEQLGILL